jgi:hypothetical protein
VAAHTLKNFGHARVDFIENFLGVSWKRARGRKLNGTKWSWMWMASSSLGFHGKFICYLLVFSSVSPIYYY